MPGARPYSLARFTGKARREGFTLVEMMAAVAVLLILLGIILAATNSVSATVRRASSKIDAFAAARSAFDLMSHKLSQATLNTYWDYDNPLAPTVYRRASDMQFLVIQNTQNPGYGQEVYFQAPESFSADPNVRSTNGLLNACGFFIQYCGNESFRPGTMSGDRYRYRLMQGFQPTEELGVYNANPPKSPPATQSEVDAYWANYWNSRAWITDIRNTGALDIAPRVSPLADNVIALIVWPRLSAADDPAGTRLAPNYVLDTKNNPPEPSGAQSIRENQLPPVVQVTLVLISEASALRLDTQSATPPQDIEDALSGKFQNVSRYQQDLDDLSAALAAKNIEFHIINSAIALRESKWSDDTKP